MSQYSLTANFGFSLIDYNTFGWHNEEYANWRKLDSILASLIPTQAIPYEVGGGTGNATTVAYTPAVGAYVTGLLLSYKAPAANSGPLTLNINGLGAKNVYRNGAALAGGEIASGDYVKVIYDGIEFQLLEPADRNLSIPVGSIDPTKLSTGRPTWDASGNINVSGQAVISGPLGANALYDGPRRVFAHAASAGTYDSAKITFSTAGPTGGSDGDIWIQHAA